MKHLHRIRALIISHALAPPPVTTRTLCSAAAASDAPTFSLKNVTKSNFESTLPDLLRHIRAADFVALDLEMTGVTSAPWRESFEFDRYDVHYLKVKDSAEKFAVVQFGVCPFRWDPNRQSFIAHPHNFYIFPRQELPADGPTYEFLCQTTSIDFLARYQFDFNACIREGVSYLSREQEEEALCHLKSAYDNESTDAFHDAKEVWDIFVLSIPDILFTERMKIRFNDWRAGLLQEGSGVPHLPGSPTYSIQQLETIFFKMRPALSLKGFTSHQLRLIKLVTREHFKDLIFVRAYDEDFSLLKLIVYIESENDKKELLREVKDGLHAEAARKVKVAVGFRQVIDILSAEKKLIVGHNCFLDVAHIYRKFIGPLPSTVEEYVSDIHKLFPHIIDTKVLLNADTTLRKLVGKTRTSLSSAFALLCPEIASRVTSNLAGKSLVKVEVQVDDKRSSNWNSGAKHEAGYDAFMTGCVFAQSCSHLAVDFGTLSPSSNGTGNENLQKVSNQLYLSWNSGDIINLSTGALGIGSLTLNAHKKKFFKICHENIVLIWGLPSELKASQIKECICNVFGLSSVTSIYHLDSSAVFVQFSKQHLVSDFLELKERLETSDDAIFVLHPLSKLLERDTRAAGYEIYKEICSFPLSEVLFADQAEAIGFKWKTQLVERKGHLEDKDTEQSVEETRNMASIIEGIIKINKADISSTCKMSPRALNGTCSGLEELLYGSSIQQKIRATIT